jgi:hypothetical protein
MKAILVLCAALIAGVVLGLSFAGHSNMSASSLVARLPSGSSRTDALEMTCLWTSLAAASNVWYTVRPLDEEQLDIRLVTFPASLEEMEFQVYAVTPEGSGEINPIGRGRVGDTRVFQEWIGTVVDGATYYVNVLNNSLFQVDYVLCDPYRRKMPFQEWQ